MRFLQNTETRPRPAGTYLSDRL